MYIARRGQNGLAAFIRRSAGRGQGAPRHGAAAIIASAMLLGAGSAGATPAALCEAAAARAAATTGVPRDVLLALTLAETGRRQDGALRPWPWAVNMGGPGWWFDNRDAAMAHVNAALADGTTNIDIGCFQINHRWHRQGFASLEDMFDPDRNALYAARFLAELAGRAGDWSAAAGAYHSRTPDLAARYRHRFDSILAALPKPPAVAPLAHARAPIAGSPAPGPRQNLYPLLTGGGASARGSLFPSAAAPGLPLLARPAAALIGEG